MISQKIKVFISSQCDKPGELPKYNPIRKQLMDELQKSGIVDVYTFENTEHSRFERKRTECSNG